MDLAQIKITNFRSIRGQTLKLQKIGLSNCTILVGMNEGGKSNLLKAINSINEEIDYSIDCNKEAKKDGEAIEIEYIFSFNQEIFKNKLKEKGLISDNLSKLIKIESISQKIYVDETDNETDFRIVLVENKGFDKFLYNISSKKIETASDVYNGEEILDSKNITTLLPGYAILGKLQLQNFLQSHIGSLMYVPKIIFWKSSGKYLINESIDLKSFKNDFNVSIPLRNIFLISDIDNIKERIELIEKDNEARDELADELSEKITLYINQIWPEHRIRLEVKIEESLGCRVNVIDEDSPKKRFSMEQRSDGFKQFISILLNLSVENKRNKLKNYIILLDEPEVHLHPSGIKYLRDELLEIGKNNSVILSTHSIYMVDKKSLNRHIKIEKIDGETSLTPIEDNPYKEEVIYESLGTSILEHVKANMILLEGKTDKDIFDAFTEVFKDEFLPLDIGTISADGVEKIENYAKFFDGKLVKGFILVDSDKAGAGQKERLLQLPNYSKKNVFEINDIKNLKFEATLEDLLPHDILINKTNEIFGVNLTEDSLDKDKPSLEQIKKQLRDLRKIGPKDDVGNLKGEVIQSILIDLKTLTKDELKKKYKKYFDFISKFHQTIKHP